MRKIVTERDVRQHAPGETLYAGPNALLTDLARETARLLDVRIRYADPPTAGARAAGAVPSPLAEPGKLCVNLPDREGTTYVVQIAGGTVSVYERTGGKQTLLQRADKRICIHPK